MEPTLHDGDGLIGRLNGPCAPGSLRVVPHPFQPSVWLVKRVGDVRHCADEASNANGLATADQVWLRSDNDAVTSTDSRELGWLPLEGTYQVVVRWPYRRRV